MPQDARDHRLLGDGGNDPQCATAAQGKVARLPPPTQWRKTRGHIQRKDAPQQPGPVPIRGSRLRFLPVYTLLARRRNNRVAQRAMRR